MISIDNHDHCLSEFSELHVFHHGFLGRQLMMEVRVANPTLISLQESANITTLLFVPGPPRSKRLQKGPLFFCLPPIACVIHNVG